jgi:hypothetical protein
MDSDTSFQTGDLHAKLHVSPQPSPAGKPITLAWRLQQAVLNLLNFKIADRHLLIKKT